MRNYSKLFDLYSQDEPDDRSEFLQRIGKICFTVMALSAGLVYSFSKRLEDKYLLLIRGLAFVVLVSFFAGLFSFIAVHVHFTGSNNNTSSLVAGTKILFKTFIYFLLPVAIFVALILAWAYMTNQPGVMDALH